MAGRFCKIQARAMPTLPIPPPRTNLVASMTCGMLRRWMPSWTTRLYFLAASTIRRPSTMLWLAGFSV